MLTQKLIAHLPLLLHDDPREVGIIGLGSGVDRRRGAHAIRSRGRRASRSRPRSSRRPVLRRREPPGPRRSAHAPDRRRRPLAPAARRSGSTTCIISEPSNPWIAGVAALFTREFFVAARDRLAPGGIICQWANAYNISEARPAVDCRHLHVGVPATAPSGWSARDDVLLVASDGPLDERLAEAIERNWHRPGVAGDLREVAVASRSRCGRCSSAGPRSWRATPRARRSSPTIACRSSSRRRATLHKPHAGDNGATPDGACCGRTTARASIRDAHAGAGAAQWRNRGVMWRKSNVHAHGLRRLRARAAARSRDGAALDGLVRTAVLTHRAQRRAGVGEIAHRRARRRPTAC